MPVGVICPECLHDQQAQQQATHQAIVTRMPRRRRPASANSSRPMMTYGIIGVTAAVSLLGFIPGAVGDAIFNWLALWAPLLYPQVTGQFEPWRLLTSALVHSGFWHLGLNMLALWMIGSSLEPLLGRARFLTLYVLGALGGSVAVALLSFPQTVVGASGAIFGLFGALLVIGRHIGANITGIAVILAINLAIGFIPGFNVSWQAHVGGLAAGAAIGLVYARTRSVRQKTLQTWLVAAIGVALVLLLLLPPVIYG